MKPPPLAAQLEDRAESRASALAISIAALSMSARTVPPPEAVASPDPTDVLLVYQPAPLTSDWVHEFRSLLQEWLSESLGRQTTITDLAETEAANGKLSISGNLPESQIAVVIVTRRLLKSVWAEALIPDVVAIYGRGRLLCVALDRGAASESAGQATRALLLQ
ncbi:MAG TPA: hypothetical protein VNY06_06490 [Methylocella sp.]|nr:hypothetical protein [Methylocella sp.]